ncbi:MAG: phosphate/phosphite/phosphonate ABC transporter substrate-binding protein [Gammaproteobacteria bacterium]|nr:phosphate/phosphite/phosphonate ABC transporter substrate-binding protein [Gammaproteobacteria bacterium]
MHSFLKYLLLTSIVFFSVASNAKASSVRQGEDGLVFGLLPFMSPISLFKRFAPLRDYIMQNANEEIVFETANGFDEFVARTKKKQYDIILTAPHFVNSAIDTGHYKLLATFKSPLSANILVRGNSEIRDVKDLRGKKIGHAPETAFIPVIGRKYLDKVGLKGEKAPVYKSYRTHNAAYHALTAGEIEAAIIGPYLVKNAIEKDGLRLIAKSNDFPSIAVLGSKRVSTTTLDKISKTLIGMENTPEGSLALTQMSCPGFREASNTEFNVLRTYLSSLD